MHHTKDKGDIGLQVIAADLSKKGYKILFPTSEHLSFDLAIYDEERAVFYRIQCKYRVAKAGKVEVKLTTSYLSGTGSTSTRYEENSFDILAIYNPDLDMVAYMNERDLTSYNNSISFRIDGKTGRQFQDYAEVKP